MSEDVGRRLVLLRHAKSAWPDVPDHDRPLARRGQRNAPAIGGWLRDEGLLPDQVMCSTARRASETWQLARVGLGTSPPVSFDERVYRASAKQLLDLIHLVPPAATTLLVVGHDPGIPELAVSLAAAAPSVDTGQSVVVERMRAKFPTAAVAVLEFTGDWEQVIPGSTRLTCFITPRELIQRD